MAYVTDPPLAGSYVVVGPINSEVPMLLTPVLLPPMDLSEEELRNGEIPKTCQRCGALYKNSENPLEGCRYHPGQYNESKLGFGFWSCCKLLRGMPGCTKVPHEEAPEASSELKRFLYMTSEVEHLRNITPNMMPGEALPGTTKRRIIRADNYPKEGYITHTVQSTDTLDGVSLKYDVPKTEIFKANRGLSAANFPAFRSILIPVGDAEVILATLISPEEKLKMEQERLCFRFAKTHHISNEEATAYLSSNDYDIDLATKDYLDDLAFESSTNNASRAQSSRSTQFTPLPSSTTRK